MLEPEWYLHPEQRPVRRFDLTAVEGMAEHFEGWSSQALSANRAQVRAAISDLPEEVVERVVTQLVQNRMLTLTPRDAPGSRMVVVALYEFDSRAGALHYLAAADRLNRIKDELITKEGSGIELLEASYKDIDHEGAHGVSIEKRITYLGQEVSVSNTVLARGPLVVELLHSNHVEARAKRLARAAAVLGRAVTTGEEEQQGDDGK